MTLCACGKRPIQPLKRANSIPLCGLCKYERAKYQDRERRRGKHNPKSRRQSQENAEDIERKLALIDQLKRRLKWAA